MSNRQRRPRSLIEGTPMGDARRAGELRRPPASSRDLSPEAKRRQRADRKAQAQRDAETAAMHDHHAATWGEC